MTLIKDGGTLRASGIITEPRFSLASKSKILNQSMLKIVKSPGSSKVMASPSYVLKGSKLKYTKINKVA